MEDYMGICPNCGDKDFGGHTVLNSVDKLLQVPSLLTRLNKNHHSYILECSKCKTVYEDNSDVILTADEVNECNVIWKNDGEC